MTQPQPRLTGGLQLQSVTPGLTLGLKQSSPPQPPARQSMSELHLSLEERSQGESTGVRPQARSMQPPPGGTQMLQEALQQDSPWAQTTLPQRSGRRATRRCTRRCRSGRRDRTGCRRRPCRGPWGRGSRRPRGSPAWGERRRWRRSPRQTSRPQVPSGQGEQPPLAQSISDLQGTGLHRGSSIEQMPPAPQRARAQTWVPSPQDWQTGGGGGSRRRGGSHRDTRRTCRSRGRSCTRRRSRRRCCRGTACRRRARGSRRRRGTGADSDCCAGRTGRRRSRSGCRRRCRRSRARRGRRARGSRRRRRRRGGRRRRRGRRPRRGGRDCRRRRGRGRGRAGRGSGWTSAWAGPPQGPLSRGVPGIDGVCSAGLGGFRAAIESRKSEGRTRWRHKVAGRWARAAGRGGRCRMGTGRAVDAQHGIQP